MLGLSQRIKILFQWSKGASTRKRLISLIYSEQTKGNAVYISRLTKLYNSSISTDEKCITNSSIRKSVKLLKHYNLIKAVNEGGKPEYLELTQNGLKVFESIDLKEKKNSIKAPISYLT